MIFLISDSKIFGNSGQDYHLNYIKDLTASQIKPIEQDAISKFIIASFYIECDSSHGDFPNAESFYNEAISLPIFPTIPDKSLEKVVRELQIILS